MGKKGTIIIFCIALLIIASSQSFAVGISVSPASLNYDNVLKGGYAQAPLYIGTDTSQNLSMFFEFSGDIKDWVRIVDDNNTDASNITVSLSSPKRVKVVIEPPSDTANGNYSGYVRIITDKMINPETGIGSSVKAAFMVNIKVAVTGDQLLKCSGGGIAFDDAEIGFPLIFGVSIANEGNVRINPEIMIDIYDKYQKEIVYSTSLPSTNILPTESERIQKEITPNLPDDQYWAALKVPQCGIGNVVSFNILEKGGVSDKGELVRIENQAWAETGEIIPITAVFQNSGARTVTAQFKGEVLLGDKVVKVIDTDRIDAAPGEVIKLQTFYKPGEVGQYFVRGRVVFNNKLTTEKGSVINVNPGKVLASGSASILFYAIIIIIIAILVMLILIKKKKQKIRHMRK